MGKKGTKFLIFILIVFIIGAGSALAYKIYMDKNSPSGEVAATEEEKESKEPEIKIFNGKERPIAVMIDNHKDAWPQAGLNKAYMVYEIVVEGGETRLMACFKGVDVEKIGPVRSSRHYFLDYAKENDAIYAHYGWSPQAESDIKKYTINNLNGIQIGGDKFWRVKQKNAPHNVMTSTSAILEAAKEKGYKTNSTEESVLNYVPEEVNLESGQEATTITIPHSKLHTVVYTYDAATKRYTRQARKVEQKDLDTGEPITTKNIIIVKCDNVDLKDKENKGRQDLKNIGTFDGYYITNGKAIPIKCTKTAREEKSVYKDLEGNVIKVNDGNTFVNICPTDAELEIVGSTTAES